MRYTRFCYTLLVILLLSTCGNQKGEYVCTPCDLPCDDLRFSEAGICPHCQMGLIKASELVPEIELTVNEIDIRNGSGKFLIEGGFHKEETIVVHYYKPENMAPASPVIFVIPGAGRNGDDYRDAWIEQAEKYNLLVLSPEYTEEHYPEFWSYNLAGMIYDVDVQDEAFKINDNQEEWIYGDFDRIFSEVKSSLNLQQEIYDMFGHSAGGQILHRLAIYHPINKANRILTSNSGWYTVTTNEKQFPYGLNDNVSKAEDVDFSSNLIVFLGEKDDANETRGHLRRSPEVDVQGLHRLARGNYFYDTAKEVATQLNLEFNWKLIIIPGIGHDFEEMSKSAASYLYDSK